MSANTTTASADTSTPTRSPGLITPSYTRSPTALFKEITTNLSTLFSEKTLQDLKGLKISERKTNVNCQLLHVLHALSSFQPREDNALDVKLVALLTTLSNIPQNRAIMGSASETPIRETAKAVIEKSKAKKGGSSDILGENSLGPRELFDEMVYMADGLDDYAKFFSSESPVDAAGSRLRKQCQNMIRRLQEVRKVILSRRKLRKSNDPAPTTISKTAPKASKKTSKKKTKANNA